jgi:hypothetical protein
MSARPGRSAGRCPGREPPCPSAFAR